MVKTSSYQNSKKKNTYDQFTTDCKFLLTDITDDDAVNFLDKKISVKALCDKYKQKLTPFEQAVLNNLQIKYLYSLTGTILNHTTFKLSDLDLEMIKPIPQGGNWKNIPTKTVQKSQRLLKISATGGRTTLYGRIDYNKPSYTITTYFNRPGNGTYVHPIHDRVLSVREAARFQTFPDNYIFCGTKTDVLKQIGNAVPVIMAYNIGKAIKKRFDCCKSVDLFSGAGGLTYGFEQAGIQAVIANDIMKSACLTLKTNLPHIPVLCGDITKNEIKQEIINVGKKQHADIICGGPPCQGFSMAGFRKTDDPRNELFRHFIDVVKEIQPKVVVFENVEGLLSYKKGETYKNIINLFSEIGYFCEGRLLYANQYCVPQKRKRVIIICTRKDLNILPSEVFPNKVTPSEKSQVTAYQTIHDLDSISCSEESKYTSSYTSDIINYLKGDISIDDYLNTFSNSSDQENVETIQTTLF